MQRPLAIFLLLSATLGCTGSRWARDDPDYAAKYDRHTDSIPRTLKQAIDARHVRGKSGHYASLGGSDEPFGLGGEVGFFEYQTSALETRIGLAGLIHEGDQPVSGGALAAARLQSPSRVAPFVGFGVYGGVTPPVDASMDRQDNDGDGSIDEFDETTNDLIAAIVPEAGCHFWLTPSWRLTGSTSYLVTTGGRDSDFLLFNFTLAHLDISRATSRLALTKRTNEVGWEVGDGQGDEVRLAAAQVSAEQSVGVPTSYSQLAIGGRTQSTDSEDESISDTDIQALTTE